MTATQLRRLLRRLNCVEVRQSGSHLIVRCCDDCQTVIPVHHGDVPRGTLRAIERALEPCLGKDWMER